MTRRILGSGFLMIAVGFTGMVVSTFADSIGIGRSGFGLDQLSGLILGIFTFLAGLVRVYATNKTRFARILAGLYMSGVLFMGLMPKHFKDTQIEISLDAIDFFSRDFIMNTLGFILFGYLFMLSAGIHKSEREVGYLMKIAALVAAAGVMISLLLEVTQYYFIPGRVCSLADVVANSFGTILGIFLYFL